MAEVPKPPQLAYGELELAVFRKQWADYMLVLPQARLVWSELAPIYPDEDDRLRWLALPNRALPEGVSPSYCVGAGRAEEALALIERLYLDSGAR